MVGGETNLKTPMLIHDPSSIFYLHPSEGTGMSITKYVLNGDNYDVWALAVMNGLEGKNKQGFINGEIAKPTDEQSPEFMAWRSNNSTICGWLFNSIDISIQPSVVGHKIAIDMWNDIKERYAIMNGPRIHQLKIEYHTLRQKGMTVVNYYNKFKSLWDALYGVEDITCGCNCAAAAKIRLRAERDKTHDFLMGLDDDEFRSIRTQILGMDPFPVLNRAFSLVTQEERHKNIIRGRDDKNDILSFAVQSTTPIVATTPPRFAPLSQPPIAPLTCTYCDKIGHDYDHCYERLGYPTSGRGRGRGSGRGGGGGRGRGGGRGQPRNNNGNTMPTANAASSSNVAPLSSSLGSSFTPDQVQRLLHLIDSPSATTMNGEKMQSIEQGMERKILVRSLNNIKDKVQYQNEDGNMVEEIFRREEFHIVDLKLDKIYHNCLPSLRRAAEVGEMVALGQSIFIFGGENEISSPLPDSQLNYYVGASHLHFGVGVGVGGTWGPAPINDPNEYNYTYLNGDVYCIGNVLAPKVLHVDTTNGVPHGSWKSLGPLPSKLVDCSPSMPVIPDPTNNRILIHLNDGQLSSSSLYAFYPPTHGTCAGTWKCLDSNVSDWDRVQDAALLDGVLYLHAHKLRNLVHAYEVATAKWFDVQWSTRVIEKDFSVDDCTSFRFDSLFCLDDTSKILCLAVYSPVVPIVPGGDRCDRSLPTNTTLLFFKFKAERCGSTITLTPLYTRSYEILSTYQVLDFLPL